MGGGATGQVLAALRDGAALPIADPAYQRGLMFLLKTQQTDGSWQVSSRLHHPVPVSPPYFESGFPYKHDQFISIMGTSWAATALLQAFPPKPGGDLSRRMFSDLAAAEQPEWVRVAVAGSAPELEKLLDSGVSPNSKTAEGTTALMLAALDLEKVKLLVGRGADVNAHAATGITPLMAAAQYPHNASVVRLLLEKGARANPDPGAEVRNDGSALFFAVMADDVETVDLLTNAGAKLTPMRVIGTVPLTPLNYAVTGDGAMVECLIRHQANPNEVDLAGISMLARAVVGDRLGVARVLLGHGANVNHVDRLGMTPLQYAASIDFGNSEMFEMLLSAGADVNAKNKDGLAALDLARKYHHRPIESLMAQRLIAR